MFRPSSDYKQILKMDCGKYYGKTLTLTYGTRNSNYQAELVIIMEVDPWELSNGKIMTCLFSHLNMLDA